jgi:hypothetical protein
MHNAGSGNSCADRTSHGPIGAAAWRGLPFTPRRAIPHFVVLFFLEIGAVVAVVIAWFAILFTGWYPRQVFDFVEGVIRWHNRVAGYAFILITDQYPPFRLTP